MISVIIPLHNKRRYVSRSLASVFDQSYKEWELIIIDDGSDDDSYSVVQAIIAVQSDAVQKKCRLIRQQNVGVSATRNRGATLAHGEWFAFLDADDWWATSFLDTQHQMMIKYPNAAVISCNYTLVQWEKTRIACLGVDRSFEDGIIDYCETYLRSFYMPVWTGATCVSRSAFELVGGFNRSLHMGEDFDLWLRLSFFGEVVLCNRSLAYYNQEVDVRERAVGRMHSLEHHFLFHLDAYAEQASKNVVMKRLFDRLRVYGLLPYYVNDMYVDQARSELAKVDWENVAPKWRLLYRLPRRYVKLRIKLRYQYVEVKKKLINCFIG